jgi:hypothetical protein
MNHAAADAAVRRSVDAPARPTAASPVAKRVAAANRAAAASRLAVAAAVAASMAGNSPDSAILASATVACPGARARDPIAVNRPAVAADVANLAAKPAVVVNRAADAAVAAIRVAPRVARAA